jgi:hypothetical protein
VIKKTVIPVSTDFPIFIPEDWMGKPVAICFNDGIITVKGPKIDSEKREKSCEDITKFYDSVNPNFRYFEFGKDEVDER